MAECRGLVKLFGMTIPVPAEVEEAGAGSTGADELRGGDGGGEEGGGKLQKINEYPAAVQRRQQDEEVRGSSSSVRDSRKECAADQGDQKPKAPAAEEQQKNPPPPPPGKTTIKKPDTILPCPRCNSMDTKFCYYNNYNVNQPRHFCKSCQRYWTAGGTMRNVPVGAGRRKNKHSAAGHYHQIAVAEAAVHAAARPDITELLPHTVDQMNPNGTVLSFAADWPLYESMASLFNLAGKTTTQQGHTNRNGLHTHTNSNAEPSAAPFAGATVAPESTTEENSSGSSSVTASTNAAGDGGGTSNNDEAAAAAAQKCREQGFSLGGAPWPYPWAVAAPAMCASRFPAISFYPVTAAAAPYWGGCTVPGAWSVPWLAPLSSCSPPSSSSAGSAGPPNPPTLGKRSREEDADADVRRSCADQDGGAPAESKTLWIPKTLRIIDDPEVAAKSSVWATMARNNNGKGDVGSRRGLFEGFDRQPNKEARTMAAPETSSLVLHANPAALSRSLNFREGA